MEPLTVEKRTFLVQRYLEPKRFQDVLKKFHQPFPQKTISDIIPSFYKMPERWKQEVKRVWKEKVTMSKETEKLLRRKYIENRIKILSPFLF